MNKFKIAGLALTVALSSYSFGQNKKSYNNEKEGKIVMTQAELDSFLDMVAQKRREQLNKRGSKGTVVVGQRTNSYKQDAPEEYTRGNGEVSAREIDRLYDRVDQLAEWVYWGKNNGGQTVVAPNATPKKKSCCKAKANLTDDQVSSAERIAMLEQQLAELKNGQTTEVVEENYITPERRSALEELLAQYKNFKQQVFFANNSVAVNKEYNQYIKKVAGVLKENPELAVVLKGYASPVGAVEYNKQLSMRRSEAISAALEAQGISRSRIIEGFYGEDHSTTEAKARRVDMTVVIK